VNNISSFKIFTFALFGIIVIGAFFTLYDMDDGINYDANSITAINETYDTPSFSFLQSLKSIANIETGNDFIDGMLLKFLSGMVLLAILYYLRSGN
jgi:hypothetical protein